MSKPEEPIDPYPLTAYEKRQALGEESLNEYIPLTKENLATMLALLGKAKQETKSPTAIVMLEGLEHNLKIMFDRMHRNERDFALLRIAQRVNDDRFFEYGRVPKGRTTFSMALAGFLNVVQQQNTHCQVELIHSREESTFFEFIVYVQVF